jgi:hypothetical protein
MIMALTTLDDGTKWFKLPAEVDRGELRFVETRENGVEVFSVGDEKTAKVLWHWKPAEKKWEEYYVFVGLDFRFLRQRG